MNTGWSRRPPLLAILSLVGAGLTACGSGDVRVYLDAPSDGAYLAAGPLTVEAHASTGKPITSISLLADGRVIDSDSTLDPVGQLRFAGFTWNATPGRHTLAARVGTVTSRTISVLIGPAVAAPQPSPTPARTPAPILTRAPVGPPARRAAVVTATTVSAREIQTCTAGTRPRSTTFTVRTSGQVASVVALLAGASPARTVPLALTGGVWTGSITGARLSDNNDRNDNGRGGGTTYNDFTVTIRVSNSAAATTAGAGTLRVVTCR